MMPTNPGSSAGGAVTMRLYPRLAHTINDDEVAFVRAMMRGLAADKSQPDQL